MGRRGSKRIDGSKDETDWSSERTLAAAEADQRDTKSAPADTRCPCGSDEFVLEAFLHVVAGRARPSPLEIESLTCPQCGREFAAIEGEPGVFLRGEFRGYAEIDD